MIRIALKSDALSVALLHQRALKTSFLAKLGIEFLESLYVFLIKRELVIVCTDEIIIRGFVSFSYNSSDMMKRFLFTCPSSIIKLFGTLVSSPIIAKRFVETFVSPFKSKTSQNSKGYVILPKAELLSISVDPNCQRSGIGSQLIKELEKQLIMNGIKKYKVIAGVSLESANKLYLRNGFVLESQIVIHEHELSNIYLKVLKPEIETN